MRLFGKAVPGESILPLQAVVLSVAFHGIVFFFPANMADAVPGPGQKEIAIDVDERAFSSPAPEPEVKAPVAEPEPSREAVPVQSPERTAVPEHGEAVSNPASSGSADHANGGAVLHGNEVRDYYREVSLRIETAKRYPARALRRRQEGRVSVSFTLNRQGLIVDGPRVEDPGASALLTEAAVAAIVNSSPFPPFNGDISQETISFKVSINFEIKR